MAESHLTAATARIPFANGTEGSAWEAKWCAYCRHDHDLNHDPAAGGQGCEIMAAVVVATPDEWRWPEAWLPEPDDGRHFLPSRLCCLHFEACTEGSCTGDPGADARAERVADVTAYWEARG